jgi:murein L,D-transpeptidase YafK
MRAEPIGATRRRAPTVVVGLALAACLLAVPIIGGQIQAANALEKADRIEVHKKEHTMNLLRDGKVLESYKVALSTVPVGPKEREGDHKVPEGLYIIDRKNAQSKFHLALHINYPNAADRERARRLGVKPGGDIEIHGLGTKFAWLGALHRQMDWTDGCIAVTNSEIEKIWPLVDVGTVVEIRP